MPNKRKNRVSTSYVNPNIPIHHHYTTEYSGLLGRIPRIGADDRMYFTSTSGGETYKPDWYRDRFLRPGELLFRLQRGNKPVGRFNAAAPLIPYEERDYKYVLARSGTPLAAFRAGRSIPPEQLAKNAIPSQEGAKGFRILIQTPTRDLREHAGAPIPYRKHNDLVGERFLKDPKYWDFTSHADYERMMANMGLSTQHVNPEEGLRILAEFDQPQFSREYLYFASKYPNATPEEAAEYFAGGAKKNLSGKIVNFAGDERSVAAKHGWLPRGRFYSPVGLLGALGLTGAAAQASTSDNPTIRNTGKAALTGLQIAELADPVSHMGRGGYAVGKFAGHQTGLHDALARTKPVQDLAVWGDTSKRSFLKNLNEQQERWEAAELDRAIEKVLAEEAAERQAAEKERQYQAMRAEYMNAPGNTLFFRER